MLKEQSGRDRSLISIVPLAAVLVLTWFFAFHGIASSDTFWHLKAGDWILEHGTVPMTDPFSYTCEGCDWIDLHWLFQVGISIVYKLFGFPGLVWMKSLLAVLMVGMLACAGSRLTRGWLIACAVLLSLRVSWDAFGLRPSIVTYALMALEILAIERFRHRPGRFIYSLVLIQLLWVNVHGLFVLGLVIQAVYLLGSYLIIQFPGVFRTPEISSESNRRLMRALIVILPASVLVSLVNPYFIRGALLPLELFTRISGQLPAFKGGIGEFISPFSARMWAHFAPTNYFVLASVGVTGFLLNFRRLDPARLLMWLVFFGLSAMAYRNVALFSFVSIPVLAANFDELRNSLFLSKGTARRAPTRWFEAIVSIAIVGWCAYRCADVASNRFYHRGVSTHRFGVEISQALYPREALDFLERERVIGRVYNSFNFGDYFIWRGYPARKVFIDGRLEVYGERRFRMSGIPMYRPDKWESFADRWGITYALLMHMGPVEAGLVSHLFHAPGWALVHYDSISCVFLKRIPMYGPMISRNEKRNLASGDIPSPLIDPEAYAAERRSLVKSLKFDKAPEAFKPLGLTNFYIIIGHTGRAEAALEQALKIDRQMPEIHLLLGQLRLKAGDTASAKGWFRNALVLQPDNAAALEGLARAKLMMNDE